MHQSETSASLWLAAWRENSRMRTRKAQGLFCISLFQAMMMVMPVLMAVTVSILSGTGAAADASLKDDGYHYMHSGIDDKIYNEWWYFNGISNETQFLVSYFISDPENVTGLRKLQVLAVVLEDGKPPVIGIQQSRGFGGDKNGPNVDIDQSGISSQDGRSFNVWGLVSDVITREPIRWDLQYIAAISPWFATPVQANVGHLKGDWMKWLVYIPSGNVTGTLTLGERTLEIAAVGYHDHNWGRWAFNDPQWNWAEVSNPAKGFSLTFGDILGEERNTMLGVRYGKDLIKFTGEQIKLTYTDFAFDQTTARIYPQGYRVQADNGDYQLDLTIKAEKSVPLLVSYPPPEPSYVIFEQFSRFRGILRTRASVVYSFDELGFSEYTTHRLHPIFGRVTAGESANETSNKIAASNITGSNVTDSDLTAANAIAANITASGESVADSAGANATGVASAIAAGAINTSTINFTVTATNERTSRVKTAETSADGWFSIDSNYADYLAKSDAPWISTGDTVLLEVRDEAGRSKSLEILADLGKDRQEVDLSL